MMDNERFHGHHDPYQAHQPEDRYNDLLDIRKDLPSVDSHPVGYSPVSPSSGDRYNNPLYEQAPPARIPPGHDYSDYPAPSPEVAKYSNPAFNNPPPAREDSYRSSQPDDRYGNDNYGNGPVDRYDGPYGSAVPADRYGNGPQDDQYGSLQPDDRYAGDDRFGTVPDERYGGSIAPDDRYGGPGGDNRYGGPGGGERFRTPSPAQGSERYGGKLTPSLLFPFFDHLTKIIVHFRYLWKY